MACRRLGLGVPAILVLLVTSCSGGAGSPSSSTVASSVTLHLGFLPNLTQSTVLVGLRRGIYAADLGHGVTLAPETFNAGPAEVEALFSGALDAAYVGPNPAITAFTQSHGQAIRIVSGATSGGAALVVRPSISSPSQLRGKRLATPQLGNTQDVALRHYLTTQGLSATESGGGDVTVVPEDNAVTVTAFASNSIDGAWVPEPYVATLVQAGGHVLVNESSLWPGGSFTTTVLVVATKFLTAHPAVATNLLRAQVQVNNFLASSPTQAQADANAEIGAIAGKTLGPSVLSSAWADVRFTNDPIADALRTDAQRAQQLGFISSSDLTGIFDLGPLNGVLKAKGESQVATQ